VRLTLLTASRQRGQPRQQRPRSIPSMPSIRSIPSKPHSRPPQADVSLGQRATPPGGGVYLTALTVLTRLTALTADRTDHIDIVDGQAAKRSSRKTETAIFPKKTIRCTLVQRIKAERTGTEQLAKFLGIRNVRVLAMQIPVHFSKHLGI